MPEIRARLYVLAGELDCPELRELADSTFRRFFGRVARAKAKPITQETVSAVRLLHKTTNMHQRDIARKFGIDGGRVNEILHGYRDGRPYQVKK
tara:strand:+ start:6523 stop:6804 length:282 start_codon:yes stop_codon:yes gene_type:complete